MKEHPEQKRGEVFYSNMYDEEFERFNLKTKRKGSEIFSMLGENLDDFSEDKKPFPVFVKKWEFEEKILKKPVNIVKKICYSLTLPTLTPK